MLQSYLLLWLNKGESFLLFQIVIANSIWLPGKNFNNVNLNYNFFLLLTYFKWIIGNHISSILLWYPKCWAIPHYFLMLCEWLITNLIMDIVNNLHYSFFNKIKDPIFIDNKKLQTKEKTPLKSYIQLSTNWRCFFKVRCLTRNKNRSWK